MDEIFKMTFALWGAQAEKYKIPKSPREWTENDVRIWLQWCIDEFQFGISLEELCNDYNVSFEKLNYPIFTCLNLDFFVTDDRKRIM